jgi:hypothetical protein
MKSGKSSHLIFRDNIDDSAINRSRLSGFNNQSVGVASSNNPTEQRALNTMKTTIKQKS